MQKICFKFCFIFFLVVCVLNSVGCASDGGQENLVLEKSDVVEAFRAALEGENKSVFTPTTTEFTLATHSISLTPIGASLRADELPDADSGSGSASAGTGVNIPAAWNVGFDDANGVHWTLKIPESGVSYVSANESTIVGYIEVGEGRLNVTVSLAKEGIKRENQWIISNISVDEKFSVSSGIAGKVTSSSTGLSVSNVSVSAFSYPYVHGDEAAATAYSDSDGNYKLFLPSGTYMVVAEGSGYQQNSDTVVVN